MEKIQPQHVTLSQLLSGRLFRVPQYQRAYSWRTKERKDLFGDILRTWKAGKDASHFMSMIVGLRRGKTKILADEYEIIEIVDGQQRITTLILLLKAIAKAADRADPVEEKIARDLDDTLVKADAASLLLLQTNHDTSGYFADYLRDGICPPPRSATTIADEELLSAISECEKFVGDWQAAGATILELVDLLKNRLTFVIHEIGDEALVYTVFEVLNTRGLDVSWFDRLKSLLMALVFDAGIGNKQEIIDEVHQIWTEIYRCIGLRLGTSTESLRFAATLRQQDCPNRPLGEADAAEVLRMQSEGGVSHVIKTMKWLQAVTEAVHLLHEDRRKNAVTNIAQARLVAVAVHLRPDLTDDEKTAVLRRWEKITFRIYGLFDKDARTAVGDYVRLAWRIVSEKLPSKRILDELAMIGSAFPIDEVVEGLRGVDCYTNWQEDLRYFFYRYEEYLARQAGQRFNNAQWNRIWEATAADSIEHVLPQSVGQPGLVHRLGNLLILPPKLNSKLGAKSPREKADAYTSTGLLTAQEVVPQMSNWKRKAVEEREEALLEWARTEWAD